MKRVIKLSATDGETKVEVKATISSTKGLTLEEMAYQRRQFASRLMEVLPGLRYADIELADVRVR